MVRRRAPEGDNASKLESMRTDLLVFGKVGKPAEGVAKVRCPPTWVKG